MLFWAFTVTYPCLIFLHSWIKVYPIFSSLMPSTCNTTLSLKFSSAGWTSNLSTMRSQVPFSILPLPISLFFIFPFIMANCKAWLIILYHLCSGTNIYFWISFFPAIVSLSSPFISFFWKGKSKLSYVLEFFVFIFLSLKVDPPDGHQIASYSGKTCCRNHRSNSTSRLSSV